MDPLNRNEKINLYEKVNRRFVNIEDLSLSEIQVLFDFANNKIDEIKEEVRDSIINFNGPHDLSMPDWYDESMLEELTNNTVWAKEGIENLEDLKKNVKSYIEKTDRFTSFQKSLLSFTDNEYFKSQAQIIEMLKSADPKIKKRPVYDLAEREDITVKQAFKKIKEMATKERITYYKNINSFHNST